MNKTKTPHTNWKYYDDGDLSSPVLTRGQINSLRLHAIAHREDYMRWRWTAGWVVVNHMNARGETVATIYGERGGFVRQTVYD